MEGYDAEFVDASLPSGPAPDAAAGTSASRRSCA